MGCPALLGLLLLSWCSVTSQWLPALQSADGVAAHWNASKYQPGVRFGMPHPHMVFLRSRDSVVPVTISAARGLVHLDAVSCRLLSSDSRVELVHFAGPFPTEVFEIDLEDTELRRDGMYIVHCHCEMHPRYWGLTVFHLSSEPNYVYGFGPSGSESQESSSERWLEIADTHAAAQAATRSLFSSTIGVSNAGTVADWSVAVSGAAPPMAIGRASAVFLDLTTEPLQHAHGTVALLRDGAVVLERALLGDSRCPSPRGGETLMRVLDSAHPQAGYESNLEALGAGTRERVASELLARELAGMAAAATKEAALDMSRSDAADVLDRAPIAALRRKLATAVGEEDFVRAAALKERIATAEGLITATDPTESEQAARGRRVAFVSTASFALKNRPTWLEALLAQTEGQFPGADGGYVMPHQWFAELYASKPISHPEAAENVLLAGLLFLIVQLKADLVIFKRDESYDDIFLTGMHNATFKPTSMFPSLEMTSIMPRTVTEPWVLQGILGKYDIVISHLLVPMPPIPGQIRLLWPENYWVPDMESYDLLFPDLRRYGYCEVVLTHSRFPPSFPGGTAFPSAPLWLYYDVKRIRNEVRSVGFDERPRSVLLELRHKHTNFLHAGQNYSFFAEQLRLRNFTVISSVNPEQGHFGRMVEHVVPPGEVFPNEGAPRGIHYWPKLQRIRYVVCPTYWPSVGQYIAEAAM